MTDASAGFETYVVGSLPRPQWVRDLIEDRKSGAVSWRAADKLLDSAVPSAIAMQERAGLDYVSDGEWRRESYVKVFADAVGGFGYDLHTEEAGIKVSSLPYPPSLMTRSPPTARPARVAKKPKAFVTWATSKPENPISTKKGLVISPLMASPYL